MRTILITITLLLSLAAGVLQAQPIKFITDGVIEYDKSVNMYAVLPKVINVSANSLNQQFIDNYKKNQPQFAVMKSTLSFAKDKSLFEPIEMSGQINPYISITGVSQVSTVYTDISAKAVTSQKNVSGEQFLLKDSVRAIKWKITDETRDILGFPCRRANAVIMDSVYVVAFYTDDIPVSGGPESFSGLPGMILQIALPHDNISWVATKVTEQTVPALKVPSKGKLVNNKEYRARLDGVYKSRASSPQTQMVLKGLLL